MAAVTGPVNGGVAVFVGSRWGPTRVQQELNEVVVAAR